MRINVIASSEFKRRIGWFMVLMAWVGMVTAVVIHQEGGVDNNLAKVSSDKGYVEIETKELNDEYNIIEEPVIKQNNRTKDLEQVSAISVTKAEDENKGKDFFVEYRIERDRTRSEQINLLREMINNPNSDKNLKTQAQERLLKITNNIEKEMEIESLIRARGYNDGIAFIHDHSVELIIATEGLEKKDVIKIGDIISKTTGISLENITIIEKHVK